MKTTQPSTKLLLSIAGALTMLAASASAADLKEPVSHPERLSPGLLNLDPSLAISIEDNHATYHHNVYRRRYYRSNVHYHSPRTVVVVREDPPPHIIVTDPPITKTYRDRDVSLSLRTVGLSFGDTEAANGTLEGNDVSGFGLGLRVGLDKHWALELAADLAGGRDQDREIAVTPLSASLMAHLFPESRLDLYGLAGVAALTTSINNRELPDENFTQLGAHLGAGAEIKMGHLLLTGDVRMLWLQPRPGPITILDAETSEQGLENPDARTNITREEPAEDINEAVQVMLGIGYRW